MNCWWCGVEPDRLIDVTRLESADAEYMAVWPSGDHEHRANPPTPPELEQAGHEALGRIRHQATAL